MSIEPRQPYKHAATGVFRDRQKMAGSRHQVLSSLWHSFTEAKATILFLGVVVVFLLHALHLMVVAEDAFITFRFARHLASGQGIVWNVGEGPVEGYTSFVWLLLSALLIKSGLNVLLFTQLLGVLASLATLGYAYRFGRNILNLPERYALIPCLFLSVSGPFAAWAASGMETNLFGMFLLIGCYYFASWVQFDSDNDIVWCYLALLLSTVTRPEGLMIFGLFAALGAVFSFRRPPAPWMKYVLGLSVYVVPFVIYVFWRYGYFGFLLPNTFYAKTGGGFYQYLRGLKYSGLFVFHFLLPLAPLVFALAWERGFRWPRRPGDGKLIVQHVKRHAGIYICALASALYTSYIVWAGGDYMAMYRFFVPILPLFYLLIGPVMHGLLRSVNGVVHKKRLTIGVITFAIGMTVLQSMPLESRLFQKPEFMHGTYQGVQYERWHVARYKVIADFFREYKRSAVDSLALGPIGVISYYSDMTVHSIFGIVDPRIAHKQMPGLGQGLPGHEKNDIPYVLSKSPTYFMFSLDLRSEPESYPYYSDETDRILRQNYQLRSVWLDDRVNHEAGYFTFLELKPHGP